MKVKFGMMVTDGRGKLGGHVLSKNRAGAYARTKVTPVNPQTSYQTGARALFGAISQGWSGLSADVILAWNAAVADWQKTDIFGDLRSPSGKALFQRLNNQAQSAGYPAVVVPPARLPMVEGIIGSAMMDLSASEVTLNDAYTGADARLMIFATPSLSAGTNFVKNQLRLIGTQLGSTYAAAGVYADYVDKFGIPVVGANIRMGVKYVLPNGQASPMQVFVMEVDA
jgi:hypothetical protein